jgi:hypothetical protein
MVGQAFSLPAPGSARRAPAVFAASDTLEFRHNDPAAVVAALQPLARSTDPAVRAAALASPGGRTRLSHPMRCVIQ